MDTHALFLVLRFLNTFDLLKHLYAAFGTLYGLLTVEGTKLCDDFLLVLDVGLLVQILAPLRLAGLGFLFVKCIVIAFVHHGSAEFNLHDTVDDPV